MSELTKDNTGHDFRKLLLTTVSVAVLTIVTSEGNAEAGETFLAGGESPPLWIELGGDLDRTDGGQTPWLPAFETASGSLTGGHEQYDLQKQSWLDFGLDGKVSFEPSEMGWVFSASVNYGRGQRGGRFHASARPATYLPSAFLDTHARSTENHTIVDFQVGKDVGLGMLGAHGRSTFSAGIRIAQFNSDVHTFATSSPRPLNFEQFRYKGEAKIDRSISAIGPSLAWSGSTSIMGSSDTGLSLDWGANAAILFGRQKTIAYLSTHYEFHSPSVYQYRTNLLNPARERSKVIPNIGGMLGLSYRLPAVKLSFGYRADVFFNAVDGGIETAKIYNRGFYGPFANISVGIGG